MSNKINKIIKKNLNTLLETKGFEEMEVAFGVKHKSDNLSDREKAQFGSLETVQDKETGLVNLGKAKVQSALDKVNKEEMKDAEEYYKMVLDRMRNFQKTDTSEPSQIGEAFEPKKVSREDDQTEPEEVYSTEALGPGMLALKYDNEGTPVHDEFMKRQDELNGNDSTYQKLRGYSEKYLKHKYGTPDEYHYTPKVRTTDKPISESTENRSSIEAGANAIAKNPEVQEKVKNLVAKLSPEQIEKLQMDIQKAINNLKNQPEVTTEADENKIEKVADAIGDVSGTLAKSTLVPIIPVAIGSIVGGVAAGFGIFALGVTGLYGISKLLKYFSKQTNESYSDVVSENIFKTKGEIKSKEQVLKLTEKLPSRVKMDETVFAITDGSNYYRLIWEGEEDGEAVITHEKNTQVVNETIDKMKHLWGFKPSDKVTSKKNIKEGSEDVFYKMMNRVRNK